MPAAGVLGCDSGRLKSLRRFGTYETNAQPGPPRSVGQMRNKDGKTRNSYRSASRPGLQVAGHFGQISGLLDFDGRDAFELLLDGLGLVLGRVLLQRLGSAVDQVLGFLQAERSDFAYRLDGVDLVGAGILEDDLELGLLLDRRSRRRAAPPPATATGAAAAAETPRRSSSFFTRAAASSRLRLTICSSNCARSAIFFSNQNRLNLMYPAANPSVEVSDAPRPAPFRPALLPKPLKNSFQLLAIRRWKNLLDALTESFELKAKS